MSTSKIAQLKIVINNGYKSASSAAQAKRLFDEGNKILPTTIVENKCTNSYKSCYKNDDAIIFLDKDLYHLRQLELMGVSVFNSSRAVAIADDKAHTILTINDIEEVDVPRTIIAPKLYFGHPNEAFLYAVQAEFDYPIVVKECYGSLGKQVYLANNFSELKELAENIGARPHLYQEFVAESSGRSLRVYVAGGKVVASGRLTSSNDFRSNADNGGTMTAVKISERLESAVLKIAKRIGLTFGGIDMFDTEVPTFIEANSNAYFAELERCSGVNIAKEIIKSVVNK
ncbi:MAG: RimK family alpha-L-glutamate ligase [Bacillota bacterium]